MILLAIDPGTDESGWVLFDTDTRRPLGKGIDPNALVASLVHEGTHTAVVIERFAAMGMALGESSVKTMLWSGYFWHAAYPRPVHWLRRVAIKTHLCGTASAKDPNVRAALIDRYGGCDKVAKGTKAAPGPLHGFAGDMWAALAVATVWSELHGDER